MAEADSDVYWSDAGTETVAVDELVRVERRRLEEQYKRTAAALQDWCYQYGEELERLNVGIDRQKRRLEHTLRTSDDHRELEDRLAALYERKAETARRYLERKDALEEDLVELRAALEQVEDSADILNG